MTKPNFTEIIVVLDRSGSMSTVLHDTIGGFNTFLKEQKGKNLGEAKLTLAQFDDQYEIVYNGMPIQDVPELTTKTYDPLVALLTFIFRMASPRGWTALYDAVMKTSLDVGKRLSNTPEHERPSLVLFVILTDGQENASREFQLTHVKDMIKQQREKYNWHFVFLGADESHLQAGQMGISVNNTYGYVSKDSFQAHASLGRGISNIRYQMNNLSDIDPAEACAVAQTFASNLGDAMRNINVNNATSGSLSVNDMLVNVKKEDEKEEQKA